MKSAISETFAFQTLIKSFH